tara:strand:+ start:3469 stop:4695 length:1227 start_codon:yes stop_codon:yes gene_type:complete
MFIKTNKMKFRALAFFLLMALYSPFLNAQDVEEEKKKDNYSFGGYIKDLRTISFLDLDTISVDNLFHNRLNFKYYFSDKLSFAIENRNRIFYGESVKANPNYADLFSGDKGLVDLSFVPLDKGSLVFHSIIDRLWINYSHEKFDLRIGRQRINWGVNLVWNPNDIFNAYSFVDFDYEERPGSDALRFQFYPNDNSTLEYVFQAGQDFNNFSNALMYKTNKWNYDFQFFTAYLSRDLIADDFVFGGAWAGNLKNAGFKGELSYFIPISNLTNSPNSILSASISVDYAFINSLYFNGSFLYNTAPIVDNTSETNGLLAFYSTDLSAKNLMPSEYSLFLQSSYSFSPIVSSSLSAIYGIDLDLLFVNPLIGISIANNWDLSLVGQLVFAPTETSSFSNQGNGLFIRTKWSF